MDHTQVYPTDTKEAHLLAELNTTQEETNELLREQNKLLTQLVGLVKRR